MGKYFPETARHAKAQEFLELKQGATTVMDYVACNTHFQTHFIQTISNMRKRFRSLR